MLILSLLSSGAAAADCARATTAADLETALLDSRRALQQLDTAAFVAATDRIDAVLPCLGEPMTRHLSAEVHRTKGIRAVSERDPEAPRFFAAARTIEPAYKFPSTVIPEGNPVRTEYAAFDLATGGFESLAAPQGGTLTLDGGSRLYRPTDWPTIAQYMAADGAISWTTYLVPGAPMPDYPAATAATDPQVNPLLVQDPNPPVPVPITTTRDPNPKIPLIAASVGSLVLTGTMYGLAGLSEAKFKDPSTPDEDLDGLRSRANSLVVVSAFTGSAAVGLGLAAIVVK